MQHTAYSIQHSIQHTTDSMQHSTYSIRRRHFNSHTDNLGGAPPPQTPPTGPPQMEPQINLKSIWKRHGFPQHTAQHTAYNIQHTAYSMQHAACSIPHTAYEDDISILTPITWGGSAPPDPPGKPASSRPKNIKKY